MKPRIIWIAQISRWLCSDRTTTVVGLGHNPTDAYRWWQFGRNSIHGTGRS